MAVAVRTAGRNILLLKEANHKPVIKCKFSSRTLEAAVEAGKLRPAAGGGGGSKKEEPTASSGGWVPHPRTGIYFPKGHEWVIDDVPEDAASLSQTYWLRNVDGVEKPDPDTPSDHYLHSQNL